MIDPIEPFRFWEWDLSTWAGIALVVGSIAYGIVTR